MTPANRALPANQVDLLIREGEGLTVEFKERYTPRIAEDMVAFAPDTFFRAVFHRSPAFALKEQVARREETREKPRVKTSEKTGEKLLDVMHENPEITTAEMAKETGLTVKSIDWNIKRLKETGCLRRVGPAKGGHWEVVR